MNDIEKLIRKVSPHDKIILLEILRALERGETERFRTKKLSGNNFYKMRKGNFRFMFHYENKAVVVDAVRLRNEKTYRGF